MSAKNTVKREKSQCQEVGSVSVQATLPAEDVPFATNLIAWHRKHGRHTLPWQGATDPYHAWLSEIMLQQTRVATVIPYYERFIDRFPNLSSLAVATLDEVLEYWSGLGYYARARNLHRAARIIVDDYDGVFPDSFDQIVSLPGIGRSTAGAILVFAFHRRYPILDGNVRRVLARYHTINGWSGETRIIRRLWVLADKHTPDHNIAEYTQGIMDLGAEICLHRKPKCIECPLASGCRAYSRGKQDRYPIPRPARARSRRRTTMIMVRDKSGRVLLERRSSAGIWGGLWSFPECPENDSPLVWCREQLGFEIISGAPWKLLRHGFTHFDLDILPLPAWLAEFATPVDSEGQVWYKPGSSVGRGIPAPVRHLLEQLRDYPL